jgi:ATP-dependent DNA ligase
VWAAPRAPSEGDSAFDADCSLSWRKLPSKMKLPVEPPLLPMLAKRVAALPEVGDWIFEPKWDGFRALIFRDGNEVQLQSRDAKPLNRYFPELIGAVTENLPERCVIDGEIVIARGGTLDFDALQMRLHPAASRVRMLSEQSPAAIVCFDLLAEDTQNLTSLPFSERRARLERALQAAEAPVYLTPATQDRVVAADWFSRFEGAGLDGVMAKASQGAYEPNKRVMLKVKHERDCDCVVAGFRWHKRGNKDAVGSLLLGLFDASGTLHHVGVCASFTDAKRRELAEFLEPYRKDALVAHPWRAWAEQGAVNATGDQRMPGGQSRWSQGKDLSWEPLRPELVVEVAYDHMQGDRFRHTAQFRRFRSDKPPSDCDYAQLEVVPPEEIAKIFGGQST